jgi:hypothetical protein
MGGRRVQPATILSTAPIDGTCVLDCTDPRAKLPACGVWWRVGGRLPAAGAGQPDRQTGRGTSTSTSLPKTLFILQRP